MGDDRLEDDWMNPPTSVGTSSRPKKEDGEVWVIQRQKRTVVFGSPGSITSWATWAEFRSKDERDAELERLRKATRWSLRGRRGHYRGGELHISEPWVDE